MVKFPTAPGVNVRLTVQVAPTARVVTQVFALIEKKVSPGLSATADMVRGAVPGFDTVIEIGEDVVLTA